MIAGPFPARAGTLILIAITAILAGLYIASIGPYWNISPDSATYVGWARSLAAGRSWDPTPAAPPVTSLVYAAVLLLFPAGYVALNAVTKLLLFGALGLAFGLIRPRVGTPLALLVVVLSLVSTQLYHASTQLLSEPAYMLFSIAALVVLDRADTERGLLPEWLAGGLLLVVVMTRTIGLALPLAVLLVEGKAAADRHRRPSRPLVAFALLAICAVIGWEAYAGQGYAAGWFRMFLLVDPWTPSAGRLSLLDMLRRMHGNVGLLLAPGRMVANDWSSGHRKLDLLLQAAGVLAIVSGLWISLQRRVTVDGVYLALYMVVVAAHMLAGGDGDPRYLVPVAPLLFFYGLEPVRLLFRYAARARIGTLPAMSLGAMGALYLIGYLRVGIKNASDGVREAHSSPFGEYPIKRPSNYDAERLALWLKSHSRPGDRYAAGQRDMFDVISERQGYDLLPARISPHEAFIAWLEHQQVRYLLVDRTGSTLGDTLLSVVHAYPSVFHLIWELPSASLYQIAPRQD
jgi:hypothetical protein